MQDEQWKDIPGYEGEIATEYGVTKECISLINTGKNWRHI